MTEKDKNSEFRNVALLTIDQFSINQRLDNYLLKHLKGVPRTHVYKIIRSGEIRVNKGRKKAQYKLQENDIVRVPPISLATRKTIKVSTNLAQLLQESIIYEDKGMLAINKPSGLAVHSGSGINVGVIEALKEMYKEPIELVHRLDRATSGVLLLAKKRQVLKDLHRQLKEREIEKRYNALVKNAWSKKKHTIDVPLHNNSRATVVSAAGKTALSYFQPLKNFHTDDFSASFVEVTIETGRTHQIRVHAQHANHPIAGDDKYGDKEFDAKLKNLGLNRLFLHASQVVFTNPLTNNIQKIKAPLSPELVKFLDKL